MSRRRDFSGSVRRLPSGRWQARRRDGAGVARSRAFPTRGDASRVPRARAHGHRSRRLVRPGCRPPSSVRAYAEDWLASLRVPVPSFLTSDLRALPRAAEGAHRPRAWPPAPSRLRSCSHPRLARRVAQRRRARAATVAKTYRLLHAICNTAVVGEQKIPRNPCMIPGASVETNPERPIATIDQVYALAEAVGERWRGSCPSRHFLRSAVRRAGGPHPRRRRPRPGGRRGAGRPRRARRGSAAAGVGQVSRQSPYGVDPGGAARRGPPPPRHVRRGRHRRTLSAAAGGMGGCAAPTTSASRCGYRRPMPSGSRACASTTSGIRGTPSRPARAPAPASSWSAWVTPVPRRRAHLLTRNA